MASGDARLFPELNIPHSTTDTWIRRGGRDVVGVDDDCTALLADVKRLERQVRVLVQVIRLLLVLRRVVSGMLDLSRLPDGHKREQLLRAIERARRHAPL